MPNRKQVLIVEDDAPARVGLERLVQSWGFTVESAGNGTDALAKLATFSPGIVLTDLVLPGMSGLELLQALKQQGEPMTIVILTGHGTVESAVEAIKQGAFDYLMKPVDVARLKKLLDNIVERHETLREVNILRRQLRRLGTSAEVVRQSPAIRKAYQLVEKAAPTDASVLISGESGTGKELVAKTIHQLSPRANQPFIAINCAAIPETLLESELFGHEKGAFTGASERRAGCFELAHNGTLFLDEIAEMTPATQVKMLRVLQERTFRRLGGRAEQTVNIRVIAATNVDPSEAVKRGTLREDLYYRLNVFGIHVPPLRERREDLPLLTQAFIDEFNATNGRKITGVHPRAMERLMAYRWPGNVRELRNVIERATIVAQGPLIDIQDLPVMPDAAATPGSAPEAGLAPGTTVADAERQLILATLKHTNGNKTHAAEMLGISVKTLHNKLNRLKELGTADVI